MGRQGQGRRPLKGGLRTGLDQNIGSPSACVACVMHDAESHVQRLLMDRFSWYDQLPNRITSRLVMR